MATPYKIKIKRDFGQYGWYDSETRTNKKLGFVVVQGGCNCIPGAGWFKSIADAMIGIEAHMIAGDTMGFYEVYKALKRKYAPAAGTD